MVAFCAAAAAINVAAVIDTLREIAEINCIEHLHITVCSGAVGLELITVVNEDEVVSFMQLQVDVELDSRLPKLIAGQFHQHALAVAKEKAKAQ